MGVLIARRGPAVSTFRTARAALGTVTQTVDVTGTLQPSAETDLDYAQGSFDFEVGPARDGWVAREGLLALGMALLTFGVLRAAGPTGDQ